MEELKKLAQFVESFQLEDADRKAVEAAKECVLDTLGFSLGAAEHPMYQKIQRTYHLYETVKENTGCILWGSSCYTSLCTAVFLNAMRSHILELDDVHTKSKTHIGTVVIPAAWCLADYLGKSGKHFLEAVICGYEVMARIGMGFGVSSHRNKGWHVTGTAGTFGAAAACAKLFNFSGEQIMSAFGLAGTQSCSTWAFLSDGATNKVLHPARAARSGLEACLLVSGGMRGSSHILDAPDGGIYPMMSDEYDYALVSAGLGTSYEILSMDKKPYPCCRSTHCAIDAAIYLRKVCRPDPGSIAEISVATYLVGLKQCGLTDSSKNPTLPTDAKFSTPYTAACALLHGTVGLNDFEPGQLQDPIIRALLKRVHVSEDPHFTKSYPKHWGCRMKITMKDGSTYEKEVVDASGSVTSPLTKAQVLSKAKACCLSFDQVWIDSLFNSVLNLEKLDQLPDLKIFYN